jgi:hypothetical protein
MRYVHFIDGKKDRFGDYHVLWHVGNYHYQIECRNTGNKIELQNTDFDAAKQLFEHVLASY